MLTCISRIGRTFKIFRSLKKYIPTVIIKMKLGKKVSHPYKWPVAVNAIDLSYFHFGIKAGRHTSSSVPQMGKPNSDNGATLAVRLSVCWTNQHTATKCSCVKHYGELISDNLKNSFILHNQFIVTELYDKGFKGFLD